MITARAGCSGTEMANDSRVLLFFIDGLGIGTRGPHNPFDGLRDAAPLAVFQNEPPEMIGAHKQGFPNRPLLDIIREHSIFLQLKNKGIESITFANTYTQRFFEQRPRWISATTAAVEAAGLRFNVVADLRAGRAIYHDFTNATLGERGEQAEPRTASDAGRVLASIVREHRFTLYEYFITDKIGHNQDFDEARRVLPLLAEFIRTMLAEVDLTRTTVLLTSDHGNIEDLSARNHTLNLVPTIIWGRRKQALSSRIANLSDITPAIVSTLTGN